MFIVTKRHAFSFAIAALVGIAVFVISVLAVWGMTPDTLMNNTMIDGWSRQSLRKAYQIIQERINQGGVPPKSLDEISSSFVGETFPNSKRPILKKGQIVDGWGRPLVYSVHGTSFTLQSYGRDGKSGGKLLDRDLNPADEASFELDYDAVYQSHEMPTLHQFLFEMPSSGMIMGCALSGLIAFVAALFLLRPSLMTKRNALISVASIFITIAATVFVATLIMQLHIPSGH